MIIKKENKAIIELFLEEQDTFKDLLYYASAYEKSHCLNGREKITEMVNEFLEQLYGIKYE